MDIQRTIELVRLLNKFRQIERVLRVPGEDRWENDTEHSFNLALMAWYLVSAQKLPFDTEKVIRYALVHDLVEVHAGDTYFYADEKLKATKKEREEKAAAILREDFGDFPELHEAIASYEARVDEESKFVYALDKIQPTIQIYLDGGRTWKEKGIRLQDMIAGKTPKVEGSPEVKKMFEELVEILKDKETELFGS